MGKAQDVPLVPWSALASRDVEGRYRVRVRLPSGTTVEKRVTVGLSDKINSQVIDGLSIGDEVIIPADGEISADSDTVMM